MRRIEKDSWLLKKSNAHRGFHNGKDIPENSIKAFEAAIENDFAIELDVHILKDDQVVVFHDDNLKRMTGLDKLIDKCTYDEIAALKLLDTDEKIPLFKDVLELVKGRVELLIELKSPIKIGNLEKNTYKLLKEYDGEYAIQSFNPFSVGWFKYNASSIIRGQLSGSYKNNNITRFKKFLLKNLLLNWISRPDFINYDMKYLDSLPIVLQKRKNKLIMGWTARNEKEYMSALNKCENVVFEGFDANKLKSSS